MTGKTDLTGRTPFAEAVRQALQAQVEIVIIRLKQAASTDPAEAAEGVHEARVALRRAQSLLGFATPWIDAGWAKKRLKSYGGLFRLLGKVRDRDIASERAGAFFPADEPDAAPLLAALNSRRDKQHEALRKKLADKKTLLILGRELSSVASADALLAMVPVPVSNRGQVRLFDLADVLPAMLGQALACLTVYSHVLKAPESDAGEDMLHQLRLAGKDLRDLVLFARPCLDDQTDALIQNLREIQQTLGSWHDTVVARRQLQKLSSELQKKEAARHWLDFESTRGEDLVKVFYEAWRKMSPDCLRRQLAIALTALDKPSGCACCSGCGGQPEPAS
ncbi:MAG: CHAD domain-containing protein [Eubacteriales bacterium]|nr:CHAD domain-containing protein [Eubacteriales bacterium]